MHRVFNLVFDYNISHEELFYKFVLIFRYVPLSNETESGLALLTVQLPSGYLADINTITELTVRMLC
jgi:hypothetical protein